MVRTSEAGLSRSTSRALVKNVRPVKVVVAAVVAGSEVVVAAEEVEATAAAEVAVVVAVVGAAVVVESAVNVVVVVVAVVDGAAAAKNAAVAVAVIATDFRTPRPWSRPPSPFQGSAKVTNTQTYPNPASAGPHSVRFPRPIGQSH